MSRNLESKEYSYLPESSAGSYQNGSDDKKIPHGISPETYNFLLTAIDYNRNVRNIFDNIDQDKLTLTLRYYTENVSFIDLAKEKEKSPHTIKKWVLGVLNTIWEELPPDRRPPHPKEEVIKTKEDSRRSPMAVKKDGAAVTALWQKEEYRQNVLAGMSRRHPPTQETITRIGKTIQKTWNKKHGIEENADSLTRKVELFREWLRITTDVLGHSPSTRDIDRLRNENKTKFSRTFYKQEFGDGSFTKAKQVLNGMALILKAQLDFQERNEDINSVITLVVKLKLKADGILDSKYEDSMHIPLDPIITLVSQAISFLDGLQENPYNIANRTVFEKDIKQIASTITTDIQEIFSSSTADEIKKRVTKLEEKIETSKNQLKATRGSRISTEISREERSIWQYAKENNLLIKIVQSGMMTAKELEMVSDYFEKRIIRADLNIKLFNKFTIAVARV